MQLLFENSDEGGEVEGLGILKGRVKKFTSLKVPHMGWNQINLKQADCKIFSGIARTFYKFICPIVPIFARDRVVIHN